MPTIEVRECANGSTSYRVRWADGGRHGTKPTMTFNTFDYADAAGVADVFATLVRLARESMPTDDQLRAHGLGILAAAPAAGGAVTIADMCSSYIDYRERNLGDAPEPDTIDLYRRYVARYVEPRALGARAAADPSLSFADVDAWQNELMTTVAPGGRGPLSKQSVLAVRSQLLAPAFTWACGPRSNYLRPAPNPMTYSKAPKPDPATPRARLWTPDEYSALVRNALAVCPEFGAMVITAAATGIRNGEYRQLRPDAVDPSRRSLHVVERVTGARRVRPGGKNHRTREVPVPDAIFDRFVAPRLAGRPHVFVGPSGGRWAYATERLRWLQLRQRMAADGIVRTITPHSLRHGYTTYLNRHIGEALTAQLVGHVKKTQTAGYIEISDADRERARALVGKLVRLPRVKGTNRLR